MMENKVMLLDHDSMKLVKCHALANGWPASRAYDALIRLGWKMKETGIKGVYKLVKEEES